MTYVNKAFWPKGWDLGNEQRYSREEAQKLESTYLHANVVHFFSYAAFTTILLVSYEMMLSVPVLLSVIFIPTVSQFLQSSNLGGGVGCVVTKNKLFSSGNYIRDLTEPEVKVLIQYKKDMMAFKKKIAQAFENAEKLEEQKGTIPPIPVRPTMPAFCKGSDTVTYIFPGCSVQNYKLFIGKTFVRTLDSKERGKMDEFVQKMGEYQKNGTTPTEDLQKNLSFCIDFA